MLAVGLTGGIATGKSTVAAMFRSKGAYVVDVDAILRRLQQPDSRVTKKIVDRWPSVGRIARGHLSINREALARVVFENPSERSALEKIMFLPTVFGILKDCLYGIFRTRRLVIVDHPYLFESSIVSWIFAKTIVVWTSEAVQKERLIERNPDYTDDHITQRIKTQMPLEEKIKRADILIDNGRSKEETASQVDEVYAELLKTRRRVRVAVALFTIALGISLYR